MWQGGVCGGGGGGEGHAWQEARMAGGNAWLGGMHGRGHVWWGRGVWQEKQSLQWAVHILLEWILVEKEFLSSLRTAYSCPMYVLVICTGICFSISS